MATSATAKGKGAPWRGLDIVQLVLGIIVVAISALTMWAALMYARPASNLAGDEQLAQRIFYIHMGCNIGALAGFLVSMIGSIVYLITKKLDWDRLAQASIEAGLVFGLGTVVTGMFWAKPTWNTYWTWDPRLTTSTITVLVYIAYLLFRHGIDSRTARARYGSIYAILAFLSVPLTFFSARWFRSIHPVVFGNENPDAQGGFNVLGGSMEQTLTLSMAGFVVLFSVLVILRWRQLRMEDDLTELREDLA